ncbi:alginate export family protein [Halioxenophilus sp. WMMB6]|uniref:alginate export family protein n=1 Tax=Halioxenophilus sp. WMMB6 TaxID=3073815 RepID=UPI00295E5822|nr:alginate export family protein [Halioxenophilus sp. WMMB6]
MKKMSHTLLAAAITVTTCGVSSSLWADPLTDMLEAGKAYGDLRLRFESVEEDNAVDDAEALTLRTRIGFKSGEASGFSLLAEFEDSRPVFGVDDYTVGPTGFHLGEYSVIADPQTTELDQALVQYKAGGVTAKVGRQVITLDGHRFVGHVGWRQDRQTFDAATVTYNPTEELSLFAGYIGQRNRIFAEAADIDSEDFLFNASYKTPVGKVVGYYYSLGTDDSDTDINTLGASFSGTAKVSDSLSVLYALEFATQELDGGGADADADYLLVEAGVKASIVTAKLGYEVLGSDDGAYGFATPLATLHKFNGWADKFLNTPAVGIVDTYISVDVKAGPGSVTAVYHTFDADEASATLDELGTELDLQYAFKFGKGYSAGVKYAQYSADDFSVDTDKFWLWASKSF